MSDPSLDLISFFVLAAEWGVPRLKSTCAGLSNLTKIVLKYLKA